MFSFTRAVICISASITFHSGGAISPGVFYSTRRVLRSRRPRLEDLDKMFAALGNGDISDVDDDEDETDEASAVVDAVDYDWDNLQELSDSSGEDDKNETGAPDPEPWCRKVFEKPSAQFQPVSDENEDHLGPLFTPYEYFSRYVPKSVFIELADALNFP